VEIGGDGFEGKMELCL